MRLTAASLFHSRHAARCIHHHPVLSQSFSFNLYIYSSGDPIVLHQASQASQWNNTMLTTARGVVQRTTLRRTHQHTTITFLSLHPLPPAGPSAWFGSLVFAGGRQTRAAGQRQQQRSTLRPALSTAWTSSLYTRHAFSTPCPTFSSSSFSTSTGTDELDGGFPTERDFHLAADATLDEVQALVDGLEDTVDDYEANLSVGGYTFVCMQSRNVVVNSIVIIARWVW